MNPCIVSFYMENIHRKTVELQTNVVSKFNVSKYPHYLIKVNAPHGIAIDYFWGMNGCKPLRLDEHDIQQTLQHDVILFLDIDCIPLSEKAIDLYVEAAAKGKLIGNAQRSNHIDNNQHVFAAPSAAALSKETFLKMHMPSAYETKRSDVLEEYTWAAEKYGVEVDLTMPLRYDSPPLRYDWEVNAPDHWALADGMPVYGMGTTYGSAEHGDLFFHNFQIRIDGQQEKFWKKCTEVLTKDVYEDCSIKH